MKKAQIVKCKCGVTFAACAEPNCYTDNQWQRDVREYIKKGCTVDAVEAKSIEFGDCKCLKTKQEILF